MQLWRRPFPLPVQDTHHLPQDEMILGETRNNPLAMAIGLLMLDGRGGEASLKVFESSTCGPVGAQQPPRDGASTAG